ncbi:MAG: DUF1553 domain-containing protein, partial [Phycisphaerae bacterium]
MLDWLAVDFMQHGWSVKRLHRQIMLSTAYRQSSRRPGRGLGLRRMGPSGARAQSRAARGAGARRARHEPAAGDLPGARCRGSSGGHGGAEVRRPGGRSAQSLAGQRLCAAR